MAPVHYISLNAMPTSWEDTRRTPSVENRGMQKDIGSTYLRASRCPHSMHGMRPSTMVLCGGALKGDVRAHGEGKEDAAGRGAVLGPQGRPWCAAKVAEWSGWGK